MIYNTHHFKEVKSQNISGKKPRSGPGLVLAIGMQTTKSSPPKTCSRFSLLNRKKTKQKTRVRYKEETIVQLVTVSPLVSKWWMTTSTLTTPKHCWRSLSEGKARSNVSHTVFNYGMLFSSDWQLTLWHFIYVVSHDFRVNPSMIEVLEVKKFIDLV